jgi:hypothetical protein
VTPIPTPEAGTLDLLIRIGLPAATFVLGAAINAQRVFSSDVISQLNEMIDELRDVQTWGSEYWVETSENESARLNEVRIRGACFLLAKFIADLADVLGKHQAEIEAKLDDLIDTVTNGGFETADRPSDFQRAVEVRNSCSEIISLVRRIRRERSSPVAFLLDIWYWFIGWALWKAISQACVSFANWPKNSSS